MSRLLIARAIVGLSSTKLGLMLGYADGTIINKVERGMVRPSPTIENFVEKTISEFVDEEIKRRKRLKRRVKRINDQ